MNRIIKLCGIFILGLCIYYAGNTTYAYFFSTSKPQITINELADGSFYKGTVRTSIAIQDKFSVKNINIFLDDELIKCIKTRGIHAHYSLPIDTRLLSDGSHNLTVQAINGTYRQAESSKKLLFHVDNQPLTYTIISDIDNKQILQGKTLHIKMQSNKPLKMVQAEIFNKQHIFYSQADNPHLYEAFIPIPCEEPPAQHELKIIGKDFTDSTLESTKNVVIAANSFKRQSLHVPSQKVEYEKEHGLPQSTFEKKLEELIVQSPNKKLWQGPFFMPLEAQGVSTPFGTIRVTQEKGRYMHKAIDFIGQPKSVIWAPQNGKVVIKDRYAISGNTIVLDHGCGVFSLLFHLDEYHQGIEVGDLVAQGNPIGTLGKTGYATGYHLHLEQRIGNIPVDPMQWHTEVY